MLEHGQTPYFKAGDKQHEFFDYCFVFLKKYCLPFVL